MGIKYKVVAPAGKYTDANGAEKTRYVDVGVIIETRAGLMLKAEAIPVGWDGTAFLNEPKAKNDQPPREPRTGRTATRTSRDEFSDDGIPDF
jgi:hypothetical protein